MIKIKPKKLKAWKNKDWDSKERKFLRFVLLLPSLPIYLIFTITYYISRFLEGLFAWYENKVHDATWYYFQLKKKFK